MSKARLGLPAPSCSEIPADGCYYYYPTTSGCMGARFFYFFLLLSFSFDWKWFLLQLRFQKFVKRFAHLLPQVCYILQIWAHMVSFSIGLDHLVVPLHCSLLSSWFIHVGVQVEILVIVFATGTLVRFTLAFYWIAIQIRLLLVYEYQNTTILDQLQLLHLSKFPLKKDIFEEEETECNNLSIYFHRLLHQIILTLENRLDV